MKTHNPRYLYRQRLKTQFPLLVSGTANLTTERIPIENGRVHNHTCYIAGEERRLDQLVTGRKKTPRGIKCRPTKNTHGKRKRSSSQQGRSLLSGFSATKPAYLEEKRECVIRSALLLNQPATCRDAKNPSPGPQQWYEFIYLFVSQETSFGYVARTKGNQSRPRRRSQHMKSTTLNVALLQK